MINNCKYIRKLFLIPLFACMCFMSSCTYDYFEDETNYVVYVPKADMGVRTDVYKVDDVKILIYNSSSLERQRFSVFPFEDNARTRVGNFHFKLYPGPYNVYTFSATKGFVFDNVDTYQTANFGLPQPKNSYYSEPTPLLIEKHQPLIQFPGIAVADTSWFERKYVGRICVAFKNLQNINSNLTFNNIKKVEILAGGVGTIQYLSEITDSINTRSSRKSPNDMMLLTSTLYKNPYADYEFGFDNNYFPSLGKIGGNLQDEAINLRINFLNQDNNTIHTLNVDIVDPLNGYERVVLHMNETIVVGVNGNNVQILRLGDPLDWNSDVQPGGNTTPGGGTEI